MKNYFYLIFERMRQILGKQLKELKIFFAGRDSGIIWSPENSGKKTLSIEPRIANKEKHKVSNNR